MTVLKDNNGTYYVRCWYRNWKGERKQKTKRGFIKLKDAKKWERDFLATEQSETITMSKLIASFEASLDTKQQMGKLQETTVETKKGFIDRYIKEYFGNAPAANITSEIVNEWLAYTTNNYGRGERMASGTLKVIRNILSQIFEYGIDVYKLKENPVKRSDAPAPFTNDDRAPFWKVQEFEQFYAALDKDVFRALFYTLYWSGLRIGECLALTPADIGDNTITIEKSWAVLNSAKKKYAKAPKNTSSRRTVIVSPTVCEKLKHYISTIDGIQDTDRIFPFDRDTPAYQLKSKIKKLGLPNASLHTMRHSFATNFIAQSKDYVSAAAELGHKSANTTLGKYAHNIDDITKENIEILEKIRQN